jgi:N6-adenosine-specific RNA methylase IME4
MALVERAYQAGLRQLARLDTLEELQNLHEQTAAVEQYLARALRDREEYLRGQQMMAELRLRAERQIGLWLSRNVNHAGGGDRRSGSRGATAVRDLPDGISKSQSSRYQQIAALPEVAFERYLVGARDTRQEITTVGLLRLAQAFRRAPGQPRAEERGTGSCTVEDLRTLVRRDRRFGAIYADPPWPYENTATRAAANNHYPTMTVEEIKTLPIPELAAESSHCHLWTTNGFLSEALQVLVAWGFEYKGVFVWAKPRIGPGNYWRVAHEFMLLGVRGRCPFLEKSQRSWQCMEPGRHSEKPEEVRRIIERVSPPPYLELFGRRLADGWTVWGEEVGTPLEAGGTIASAAEAQGGVP